MEAMKITDVKVQVFEHRTEAFRFRDGFPAFPEKKDVIALRVLTDEGLEGDCVALACHGGSSGAVLADLIVNVIKPVVLGQNPLYRELLWHRMWDVGIFSMLPIYARAPLDIALWDLAGKAANQPLYVLLGAYRDHVQAYASTLTLPCVEDYSRLARELKERGFKAIKLHAWGEPKRDVEACAAAREAVSQDMVFMFDGAGAYNVDQAIWVGRQLERMGYLWFETPIPDHDLIGLRRLSAALDIPVAVSEMVYNSQYSLAQFIGLNAGDILRADVTIMGGLTPLIKCARASEAFGLQCEVHVGTSPFADMADLHMICAMKNCAYYEVIVPEHLYHFGVTEPPITIDSGGFVHVSDKPGVGLTVDWDAIDATTKISM
jgi:L-alanine-DL-glutamate epimerase-like enolase superfamily enzyme